MTNQGVFINDKENISYYNTNLPKEHFSFTDRVVIYWLVDLSPVYRDGKQVIIVHVKDYTYKQVERFNNQKLKRDIPFLMFERLNFDSFFALCVTYRVNKFKEVFSNHPTLTAPIPVVPTAAVRHPVIPASNSLPTSREHLVEFKISFSDAKIVNRGIKFTKLIKELDEEINFTISNPFLKASYEPIKAYFGKKLKRKTFSVKARITSIDWKIVESNVHSKEIDLIDETFLQTIKYDPIRSLLKITQQPDAKQMYSIEELLMQVSEFNGNVSGVNIADIIHMITDGFPYRNSKQLAHLASKHSVAEDIIYLTLSPFFGFIFCIVQKDRRYYIWELLDTHATYIWDFKIGICTKKQAFDLVSEFINKIHQFGRNAFKKEYKERLIEKEFFFKTIKHSIEEKGGIFLFEGWLAELNALLSGEDW